MSLKVLFLSHYHKDRFEIQELATELRLRGIIPWLDKDRGFKLGDKDDEEAKRVIREESFGLLLYATRFVFERPFIKKIEIEEAKRIKKNNPNFLLVAVPRSINIEELGILSKRNFGINLSEFHTVPISDTDDIKPVMEDIARHALHFVLWRNNCVVHNKDILSLQVSTRDVLPDEDCDLLRIDASRLLNSRFVHPADWPRFLKGLSDVKREISISYGRPRLRIHGSKHLTAAFLVGRVFAPFQIDIRQGGDYWSTDGVKYDVSTNIKILEGDSESHILSIEISMPAKQVTPAVDRLLSKGLKIRGRIQYSLQDASKEMDGARSRSLVLNIRQQLEEIVTTWDIHTIHIFAAVPQALMVMLGRHLGALPSIQLYEFDGYSYIPSILIPSGAC